MLDLLCEIKRISIGSDFLKERGLGRDISMCQDVWTAGRVLGSTKRVVELWERTCKEQSHCFK